MRAVWSFWSCPREMSRGHVWLSERHHLLSWALSLETARRHYPQTVLMTDTAGARLLVDQAGLEFGEVTTELDALAGADTQLWALGKLYAYRAQERPFVHVDSDVFLWNALPRRLVEAPVFTQNPEPFEPEAFFYRPGKVESSLLSHGGWVPEEWGWYLRSGLELRGDCCGIMGGRNVEFIRHYAERAIHMVQEPANRLAWGHIPDRELDTISVEQFYLTACVEHYARVPDSPFAGVRMEHLFATADEMYSAGAAQAAGYTHLIAGAKGNPALMERLEARVARDHPAAYERIARRFPGERAAAADPQPAGRGSR